MERVFQAVEFSATVYNLTSLKSKMRGEKEDR